MNITPKNELMDFCPSNTDNFKITEPEKSYFPDAAVNRNQPLSLNSEDVGDEVLELFSENLPLNRHSFNKSQYQALLKLVNDPVIVFDLLTGLILEANEQASRSYRIAADNLIARRFAGFWQESERERKFVEELTSNRAVENFSAVQRRFDGTTFNVSINAHLLEYGNRQIAVSVISNITERVQIEQSIIRARQEWSDTVDAVSDLIILEDSDGKLRRCNKATSEFFKLPYLDLIGQSVNSVIEISDVRPQPVRTEKHHIHLREASWEGQITGRKNWYEITNHALPRESGDNAGWVHIIKDITGRKSAEAELERLYTAIEQAADAIVITDLKGFIRFANTSFEKMTGWSSIESFGRKVSDVKLGLDDYKKTEEIFLALQKGEIWQKTYKAARRSGEIFDEQVTISPVRDDEGNPINYVFVCRDVTETRRLESIAEAVNMMDNVGYVFSGIRHELGNPINSVKTALTVLKQNLEVWNKDRIDLYIERCLTETARVEYLLRTLKTFSMHENPQIEPVNLTKLMEKFVSLISKDFADKGIELTLESKGEIGEALCDPRALHQVMLNLLANSADAFGENPTPNPKITIYVARCKNQVYVMVADNGAGMSESQLGNLFKPFYTSKPCGTGLGLVIVKSMLVKMNGTISVESRQNVGTKVTFTLEAND